MIARAAAAALVVLACAPAAAHAAPVTSVALFSESRTYLDGGQRIFHPGNAKIALSGGAGDVHVMVTSPDSSPQIEFSAPPGEALRPGVYANPTSANFKVPGRPGMSISDDNGICIDTVHGQFDVRSISVGAHGAVERLWIVFDLGCSKNGGHWFGEVRYRAGDAARAPIALPGQVRWPAVIAGTAAPEVPVLVAAPGGPARLGRLAVTGPAAADFPVRRDDCSGRALAAGGACELRVGFVPTAPGARTATLHLPGGPDVPLEGFAHGGTTRVVIDSRPGDEAGHGEQATYGPGDARISARGRPVGYVAYVAGDVTRPDGGSWDVSVQPRSSHSVAVGHYTGDDVSIHGPHDTCSSPIQTSADVTTVTYDASGELETLGLTFAQQCRSNEPELHGELDYRAGDDTAPAPWTKAGPHPDALPPPGPCDPPAFDAAVTLRGTRRADRLRGTPRADRVLAGAGADHVRAGAGDDCVDAGPGRDVVDCGPGNDVVVVSPGDRTRRCEVRIRAAG